MKSLAVVFAFAALTVTAARSATADEGLGEAVPIATSPIVVGETLRIPSRRLGEEREIRVYLPDSYAGSSERYPVIYALDGEGTGSLTANAVKFMAGYPAIPQMPESIVVGIVNTQRNRDMPVPQSYGKGGEARFLAFLADELIPVINRRYRTQPLRILLGHSQGGLFANYALTARPSAFQWYLVMDAPLSGFHDAVPIMKKTRSVITSSSAVRLVSIENAYGWKKDWTALVEGVPESFYGQQVELPNGTHETMAYEGVHQGLGRLFHDYAPDDIINDVKGISMLPELEERYRALWAAYGYQVNVPRQVLLTAAAQNTAMRYGPEAVELIQRAVALYGESPATMRLMAEAEAAVDQGRDERLAEWSDLPPPDVARIKPFLGVWKRTTRDGARFLMTFEVVDSVVRTRCNVSPPNGEPFEMQVQFVRVLDAGTLQWGLRNGRGAGIILHTGSLVDENTLEGDVEPVGIEQAPSPHAFTYTRQ